MGTFTSVRQWAVQVKNDSVNAIETLVIDAYDSLTDLSPVDSGQFRANWNISTAQPDETTRRKTSRIVPTSAIRNAARKAVMGNAVIYITNGLPYARRLEYGWSTKSQGMLRRTTQKLKLRNKM